KQFLDKGISVAAINYRFVQHGVEEKLEPPVKAPLEDAARALQFVRSKAGEWNIDKKRIGATGGSAGGCSSLWLAFHDDLADPVRNTRTARLTSLIVCCRSSPRSGVTVQRFSQIYPEKSAFSHQLSVPSR